LFYKYAKEKKEEHKRAKDNEEIYSDTRQEKFERKNKKKMKLRDAFK